MGTDGRFVVVIHGHRDASAGGQIEVSVVTGAARVTCIVAGAGQAVIGASFTTLELG